MFVIGFYVSQKDLASALVENLGLAESSEPAAILLRALAEHNPRALLTVFWNAPEDSELAACYRQTLRQLLRAGCEGEADVAFEEV